VLPLFLFAIYVDDVISSLRRKCGIWCEYW